MYTVVALDTNLYLFYHQNSMLQGFDPILSRIIQVYLMKRRYFYSSHPKVAFYFGWLQILGVFGIMLSLNLLSTSFYAMLSKQQHVRHQTIYSCLNKVFCDFLPSLNLKVEPLPFWCTLQLKILNYDTKRLVKIFFLRKDLIMYEVGPQYW